MPENDIFRSFPVLETERLRLRQMTLRDAGALYAYYSDPQVTAYLDWPGPASPGQAAEMILGWNRQYAEKRLVPWGITLKGDNTLIGTICCLPVRGTFEWQPPLPATIGFELARSHWRQGLMTEALDRVLAFTFERLGAHRIQAEVLPDNAASLKLLKKFGFAEEGRLRQYLLDEKTRTFHDILMLSLLSSALF